ncbi:MAG: DUF512 domain-containing protein, partial [Clostridia bacterium]
SLPHNTAYNAGIRKNDVLLAFDGAQAFDVLDVAYYEEMEDFVITVLRNGQKLDFHIVKNADEYLDFVFYDTCYLTPKECANHCVFCFVDQLQEGLRDTLYVKDDDWRLSIVSGNFVTLTNVTESEINRIISKKFSPLYVSVHCTNDTIRRVLLGNTSAQPIMPLLRRFAEGGIKFHTQIVMCPGYNDGKILEQTISDLYSLFPNVLSVAVVPVGLTSYRQNLQEVLPVNKVIAQNTIDFVEDFSKKCFISKQTHFAYCSDEMYLIAERKVPAYEYYDNFSQIENGVGLIADFTEKFDYALSLSVRPKKKSFTIVTGVAAYQLIADAISKITRKFPSAIVNAYSIVNNFFGNTVTVAGLVVGQDIYEQLVDKQINDIILINHSMLKETENVFLDGMTLSQLSDKLKHKISVVADGYDLCDNILELE